MKLKRHGRGGSVRDLKEVKGVDQRVAGTPSGVEQALGTGAVVDWRQMPLALKRPRSRMGRCRAQRSPPCVWASCSDGFAPRVSEWLRQHQTLHPVSQEFWGKREPFLQEAN